MKTKLLFPHWCKFLGYALVLLGFAMCFLPESFTAKHLSINIANWEALEMLGPELDMTLTIKIALFIIGGVLIGFSKEKIEDECVSQLRLNSLMWSMLISYAVLLLINFCFYGLTFANLLLVAMFIPLGIFVVLFNVKLIIHLNRNRHEK